MPTASNGNLVGVVDGGVSESARLWETVRILTDTERQQIERVLTRFRALDGANNTSSHASERDTRLVVHFPSLSGATPQQWEPLALIQTLLAHIRKSAHEQSRVEVLTGDTASSSDAVGETMSSSFSLQTDDFPSLGKSSSVTTTTVGGGSSVSVSTRPSVKVTKRRITTTLISTDAPYTAVAVKPPTTSGPAVTISANGPENAWSKRNLLEKRMAATDANPSSSPSQLKPVSESRTAFLMGDETPPLPPPAKPLKKPLVSNQDMSTNPWMSPPPTLSQGERKPPTLSLIGKPKRATRVTLMSTSSDAVLTHETTPPPKPVEANLQAARLYGHIIVQRLAPTICREIRFLIGLLYRRTCASAPMDSTSTCTTTNEFCNSKTSAAFAAAAIETLEPTLVLLGTDMVQLVAKSLEDVKLCENLVSRLRNAIELREERRVEESAKIGCELPVETKGTAFRDYALPFCEDMDSRLNYRTPTESIVYSNREKIRDAFLGQLRTFQKKQNSLLGTESNATGNSAAVQDTQQLLQDVMPENLWWFARFFVLELVQIGSNPLGESDKDLVLKIMEDKMVVKNPDRLRKLHRRFSSQKGADATTGGSTTTGFQGGRPKANNQQSSRHGAGTSSTSTKGDKTKTNCSSSNNTISPDAKAAGKGDANDASRLLDHMRSFFSDNQAFFYHFLVSCDSYQFAELVKYQLEAQFLSIWREKPKADPRKEFTETVLRLKVLAKFIGYLRFSPQWHWSALTSALSAKNPALEAARREAINTLEQSPSANAFDVVELLEESIISKTVTKCIPWLCDFLSMISSDALSPSTRYVRRALLLMAYVHRSRMLDSLGETGLFVAMQIERLFQRLAANELLPQSMRWNPISVKPPTWISSATVHALLDPRVGSSSDDRTDSLPFLYSSMFVQVCIGELDDLRGFIQTRSNPHFQSGGARRSNLLGLKSSAIRKVRPLQVVSEGQLERSSSPVLTNSNADRGGKDNDQLSETDHDPLRDAFFKLYPQLKRAVEFVVDIVVTNLCEHAVNKYVKPNADALIDSCVEDAKAHAPSFTQLILHGFQVRLDERLEDFMATTVAKALHEARDLCANRVKAALRPLVPPSIPPQLISAAIMIAQAQATAAIANLITRSLRTEFLKRVAMRKRAIVKEAGAMAIVAISPGDASCGMDDSATKDAIVRTLKFSFDDSTDAVHTPLEEALHMIKTNAVAMNGMLPTVVRGLERHVTTRVMATFARFERGFRGALDDAIVELAASDNQVQRDARVLLWSWIWRGVRLSLKMFAWLIAEAAGDNVDFKQWPEGPSVVDDFVANVAKTLAVIAKLRPAISDTKTHNPVDAICRFIAHAALSIPTSIAQASSQEPLTGDQPLPTVYYSACSALYCHAVAVSPASASLSDSTRSSHQNPATPSLEPSSQRPLLLHRGSLTPTLT